MGSVYASTDWHGASELGKKVLESLKPNDILFFLGDAIDRGEGGIYLLDRLLKDPRVIFIKGNHEYMMELAVPKLLNNDWSNYYNNPICDWFNNGGDKTWETLKLLDPIRIRYYIREIKNLPLKMIYKSPAGHKVILEHAGYSPCDVPHRFHDPLWDRDHFLDYWSQHDPMDEDEENIYLVHGHTPVQYLKFFYGYNGQKPFTKEEMIKKQKFQSGYGDFNAWEPRIIRYCSGHKFDIDMGTNGSNKIALLNLDTFEKIYYTLEDPV